MGVSTAQTKNRPVFLDFNVPVQGLILAGFGIAWGASALGAAVSWMIRKIGGDQPSDAGL